MEVVNILGLPFSLNTKGTFDDIYIQSKNQMQTQIPIELIFDKSNIPSQATRAALALLTSKPGAHNQIVDYKIGHGLHFVAGSLHISHCHFWSTPRG